MWAPRVCAADDCDVLFEPVVPKQIFHSARCRNRTNWRRANGSKLGAIS
jgi:hypothetical protein